MYNVLDPVVPALDTSLEAVTMSQFLFAYRMYILLAREINAITVFPSISISLASFFTEPLLFM